MKKLLSAIALYSAIFLSAQETDNLKTNSQRKPVKQLDEIFVTGSRFAVPKSKSGTVVEIIGRAQIEATGYAQVTDLIASITGLRLTENGPFGGGVSLFIRGLSSKYVKVLIDGVVVSSSGNPATGLEHLSTDSIERIEIVKGGGASLYGADTFAGVINIITRKGENTKITGNLNLEGGAYNTTRGQLNLRGELKTLLYSLFLTRTDSKGLSKANDTNAIKSFDSDPYSSTSGTLAFDFSPTDLVTISSLSKLSYNSVAFDMGAFTDSKKNLTKDNAFVQNSSVSLSYKNSFNAVLNHNYNYYYATNTDEGGSGNNDVISKKHFVSEQNNLMLPFCRISIGGDFLYDSFLKTAGSTETKFTNKQLGTYLEVAKENGTYLNFLLGGRAEMPMNGNKNDKPYILTTRGSLAATYGPLKWSISAGTGFRAPSLMEQAWASHKLESEENLNVDSGITFTPNRNKIRLSITGFYNKLQNAIDYYDFLGMYGDYTNVDVISRGIEAGFDIAPLPFLKLTTSYTFTDAKDPVKKTDALKRPRNKGAISINSKLFENKLNLNLNWLYTGKTLDFGDVEINGYSKLDGYISYQLIKNVKPFVRIENILDEQYETTRGYSTLGRSIYGGVNVSF